MDHSSISNDDAMRSANMTESRRRTCPTCNKIFSKAEHLTRHLRIHTKETPYECSTCGKLYSRSDVLRRHKRGHQNSSPQAPNQCKGGIPVLTPLSQETPTQSAMIIDQPVHVRDHNFQPEASPNINIPDVPGMNLHDPILHADSSTWFLGADLDVDALDFSLNSAISEWAQLPPIPSVPGFTDSSTFTASTPTPSRSVRLEALCPPVDGVKRNWFTRLSVPEELRSSGPVISNRGSSFGQGNLVADESYRAGLSQKLRPRIHDEALPSSEQLNLFAKLFFSRFHSLFPVIHAPSFKPTMENSLLFVSICSVGSLFVGSTLAIAQGTRLFERLNKAILASWESILSHSCSDALSMVQAAIIGQTFAILSGRPRDLVMADVLHGTVMAWARESNKSSLPAPQYSSIIDSNGHDLDEQWIRWIDQEQRKRVEIALNVHDAELASLLHHEPIRKHRLEQYPRLAPDVLFMAPTASRWREIYRETSTHATSPVNLDDPLQTAIGDSKFVAYGVLESINAYVIEGRQSSSFDEHESKRLSNMLMRWWRRYSTHFRGHAEEDPFSLPILWHSVYMAIYVDMDLLERAIGRDGQSAAMLTYPQVRIWSTSLDASKCLVHALLIQRYLERMRVSAEPAIHVPRALFIAALSWFCFTRTGGQQAINLKAFDAPEIQLLGSDTALHEAKGQAFGDSAFADVNQLHRLIDLLNRVGRWAICHTFASALSAAIEEQAT
ncbi:hypothetical protein BJX99DRAFT_269115 [Aspergillus californicus]